MPILGSTPVNRDQATVDSIFSVPARLEAARVQLALTPAEQAEQIGVGLDTLTRVETPGSNPTQRTIIACLTWLATQSKETR